MAANNKDTQQAPAEAPASEPPKAAPKAAEDKKAAPEKQTADNKLEKTGVLAGRLSLRPSVFSGVCAANGWAEGKQVTEDEFKAAVQDFTGQPMDGRTAATTKKSEVTP